MISRRIVSLTVACGLVGVAMAALGEARVSALPAQSPDAPAQGPIVVEGSPVSVGGCTTSISHTLSSAGIEACETVTVTTRAATSCRACPGDVNVVLVRTKWIPTLRGQLDRVGEGVINELIKQRDVSGIKGGVAIVYYDSGTARISLPLTNDLEHARSAFVSTPTGVGSYGGYERGAALALDILKTAAVRGEPRCDIIVFFGIVKEGLLGEFWEGLRAEALRAGAAMRRDDSTLLTYCIHLERDCPTMRAVASSPRYYAEVPDVSKLPSAARSIIDNYIGDNPSGLNSYGADVVLPLSIGLIPDSAIPPPAAIVTGPLTSTLRWRWDTPMDSAKSVISYTLAPAAEAEAAGVFTITGAIDVDPRSGEPHAVAMPPNPIQVTGPCAPVASPSAVPTDTPPATATPTSLPPTATATTVPTAVRRDLFIPVALDEAPCTRQQRADVVLVIDASSSMQDLAGDGRTKLEAARAGAAAFVEHLRLEEGDQASIVQFNHAASVLTGLTDQRSTLLAALDSITTATETCLVCGLEAAGAVLDEDMRRPANQPIVILMTDGRSNPRPVSEAVAEAARMKARGIVIFTIGLGADLDEAALVEVSSRPAYAFRAADGAALESIYRELAVTLPGPADCYWGRR